MWKTVLSSLAHYSRLFEQIVFRQKKLSVIIEHMVGFLIGLTRLIT